jgi:mono/diheme cytochrome c family protein
MHEQHARWLAVGIGAVVIAAAGWFASRDGGTAAPSATPAVALPATPARGQTLFVELGCTRCHSFRGVGDPSGALDESPVRADPQELERWIVAAPEVAEALPRHARLAKARYAALAREDLEALVAYLGATPSP